MSGRRQSSLSETADMPNGSKKKITAKNHELIETILDPTYVDASGSEHDNITLVNEKPSKKSDLVRTTHFYGIRVKLIMNKMNTNGNRRQSRKCGPDAGESCH